LLQFRYIYNQEGKKMKQLSLIAASVILGFSTLSYAQEAQSVGISVGSIGADIEYSRLIAPEYNLALRLTAGGMSYSGDYDDTDTHYDTDLSLFNAGATLEYHPFKSGFYLGIGAYYQNDDYTMDATPSGGVFEFNGNTYPAALVGSVAGDVADLNNLVPYLGIGYDASLFNNGKLFFTFKAGAWYQGTATVNLTAHDCALDSVPGSPLGCDDLRYDLRQEEKDINEDIQDYKWWPVVQFGLSYRF
jgi:hypothetical protein